MWDSVVNKDGNGTGLFRQLEISKLLPHAWQYYVAFTVHGEISKNLKKKGLGFFSQKYDSLKK